MDGDGAAVSPEAVAKARARRIDMEVLVREKTKTAHDAGETQPHACASAPRSPHDTRDGDVCHTTNRIGRTAKEGHGWFVLINICGPQQGYLQIWATCVTAPCGLSSLG